MHVVFIDSVLPSSEDIYGECFSILFMDMDRDFLVSSWTVSPCCVDEKCFLRYLLYKLKCTYPGLLKDINPVCQYGMAKKKEKKKETMKTNEDQVIQIPKKAESREQVFNMF